jgi:hypothetical protein
LGFSRPSNLRPRKNAHTDFEQFHGFSTFLWCQISSIHKLVPVVPQDFQTFDGIVASVQFMLNINDAFILVDLDISNLRIGERLAKNVSDDGGKKNRTWP